MAGKRSLDVEKNQQKKTKTHPSLAVLAHSYKGYRPTSNTEIDVISLDSISKEDFFKNYVIPRKPVKIIGYIPEMDIEQFQPSNLEKFLNYKSDLQVEKKVQDGFGSGSERINMQLGELLDKLKSGDSNWYLTTQYEENDVDSDEENEVSFLNAEGQLLMNEDDIEEEVEIDNDKPEEEDSDEEPAVFGNAEDFEDLSDSDSLNFDDIRDDFDDGEDFDIENPVVADSLSGEPLRLLEAKKRISELIQRPLTNLIKGRSISIQPELLDSLIPQQINLWMGATNNKESTHIQIDESDENLGLGRSVPAGGISSGLHHDHADNLYIPIRGSKRFTLFSPYDADKMYTVGQINSIYSSGVIDYQNNENAPDWRHVRDDGALETEAARWKLSKNEDIDEEIGNQLIDLIEEEEEVLLKREMAKSMDDKSDEKVKRDPPSFSKIPPMLAHIDEIEDVSIKEKISAFAESKFPGFLDTNRLVANLKVGEMLYLPAGWFHEVTSFGNDSTDEDSIHSSINYWYLPPNGESIQKPYTDEYWTEDFERTKKSIQLVHDSVIKLD